MLERSRDWEAPDQAREASSKSKGLFFSLSDFVSSALHIAAKHGYAAVCSLLLERGVDGNVKTKVI